MKELFLQAIAPLRRERDHSYQALLLAALFMPFSMPAGRAMLALALLLLVWQAVRGERRRRLFMPASAWCWLGFVALATLVTWYGINPAKGMGKLGKLAWYIAIPLTASLADSRVRVRELLTALLLGCGLLALKVLIRNPLNALIISQGWGVAAAGEPLSSFGEALIDQGRMDDGQRLMVGLVGAAALWFGAAASEKRGTQAPSSSRAPAATAATTATPRPWQFVVFALLALGEIITLKRGSWLCVLLLLPIILWRHISWRKALTIGLPLLALLLALAPVRQRLLALRSEFSPLSGGRVAMWTRIAPTLIREHPWGIGFRSLTNDIMRDVAGRTGWRRLERDRDHMHSNFVEMVVSVGWLGLLLYLFWMALILRDATAPPHATFWMLCSLLLNGLVEYNFADAELVIILGLLAGLAATQRRLIAIEG